MKKEIYNLEGIEIEVEKYDKNDKDAERRRLAYCFRMIREKSGMSRTDFEQSLSSLKTVTLLWPQWPGYLDLRAVMGTVLHAHDVIRFEILSFAP